MGFLSWDNDPKRLSCFSVETPNQWWYKLTGLWEYHRICDQLDTSWFIQTSVIGVYKKKPFNA